LTKEQQIAIANEAANVLIDILKESCNKFS